MGIRKRSPQLVWSGPEASGLAGDTGDGLRGVVLVGQAIALGGQLCQRP